MNNYSGETVNRFAIAANELLREEMAPEFAQDGPSFAFLAGPPLDADKAVSWAGIAQDSQLDIVYLAFDLGRERFGPTSVAIFAERFGVVYRWTECVLWAPKDGGRLLVMPRGLNMCFSHDGNALISHQSRPTHSLRDGIARARNRLLRASRAVTEEQLAQVGYPWREAA